MPTVLSLGLSLLGIGKNLLGWLSAGAKWLFAVWYRLAIAALLAACLWFYVGKSSALASAAKWKRTAEVEMALRISNEVAYKNAQAIAADMNRKQIETIKERYDAIATETENEYEKRLADNRASLRQWMHRQAQATGRSGEGSGAGSAATLPAEPVQGTEKTEFLVSAEDLEIAADNYSQLSALIDWAKKVGEVKP